MTWNRVFSSEDLSTSIYEFLTQSDFKSIPLVCKTVSKHPRHYGFLSHLTVKKSEHMKLINIHARTLKSVCIQGVSDPELYVDYFPSLVVLNKCRIRNKFPKTYQPNIIELHLDHIEFTRDIETTLDGLSDISWHLMPNLKSIKIRNQWYTSLLFQGISNCPKMERIEYTSIRDITPVINTEITDLPNLKSMTTNTCLTFNNDRTVRFKSMNLEEVAFILYRNSHINLTYDCLTNPNHKSILRQSAYPLVHWVEYVNITHIYNIQLDGQGQFENDQVDGDQDLLTPQQEWRPDWDNAYDNFFMED